ncbi:MAG: tetratricopeptide repeat protein, partial [Planctomycetes bacterium]|nr:tetratricopeptide repeat protein [Planctomycetota bacterium]
MNDVSDSQQPEIESENDYPQTDVILNKLPDNVLTETIVENWEYAEALAQTVDESEFDAKGIRKILTTNSEDDSFEKIKQNLLDTVDDADNAGVAVDFQPLNKETALSTTRALETFNDSDPFEGKEQLSTDAANELLQKDGIPSRYTVLKSLGSGGSGQVFAVSDTDLQRDIAVKFLHPEASKNVDHIDRFFDEARLTAALEHPNILPVHELGISDGGLAYFTMRKANGHSLQELLQIVEEDHIIPPELASINDRINIVIKLCQAMAFAHDLDVIHQDIKPGNIIIGKYGEVVIIDWGTARKWQPEDEEHRKKRHRLMGTPAYMAPEQARRESTTKLSDIYCIGATFHHLLSFQYPTWSDNLESFWELKKEGVVNPIDEKNRRNIPDRLLAISQKAMATNPKERYQSAEAFAQDLSAYQSGQSISAYKDSILELLKRWYRVNKRIVWTANVALLLIALFAGLLYNEHLKEQSSWKLIHTENFNNVTLDEFASSWSAKSYPVWIEADEQEIDLKITSLWSVKNGALRANSIGFFGCTDLSYLRRIPGDMRIDWQVTAQQNAQNLNFYIGGNNRYDAYMIHVSAFNDDKYIALTKGGRGSMTLLLDDHLWHEDFTTQEMYSMRCEKEGDIIRFFINGKKIFNYKDPEMLVGPSHQYFGFESGSNIMDIDNVTIYHRPLPLKITPLALANSYYSDGDYQKAADIYSDILSSYPNTHIAPDAQYRLARCAFINNDINTSKNMLSNFIKNHQRHDLYVFALLELARVHLAQDNWNLAEKSFDEISTVKNNQQARKIAMLVISE